MRIFTSWHQENLPTIAEDVAFEVFTSDLTLRSYGLTLEETQSGIVGGGQDGAIDSVYTFFDDSLIDEDSEVVNPEIKPANFGQQRPLELWVIQSKRTPAFSEGAIDKLENTLRRVLDLDQPLQDLQSLYNPSLLARFALFRDAWEKLLIRRPKIHVHVVYATPGLVRGVSPQVEAKANALEQELRSIFPDAEEIDVRLLGDSELLTKYNERPSYTFTMRYQEAVTSGNSHIALVALRDYFELIVDENNRLRKHLFEYNVRDYQGNVSVNQEIRRSLTRSDSPEFWWLNNGITIVCTEATSAGKTFSLSDIQIVNGLQTSHEVYEALRDGGKEAPVGEKMGLIRIIVTDDAVIRDQVIRATNRQTAIQDSSLRATDDIQRQIENYFLTRSWFYDRRKNFYKNQDKDPARIVSIPMLGAAMTAIALSRPDKSRGKPSSLLKVDDDYNVVFNDTIDLAIYFWVAKTQRQVDTFVISERARSSVVQKSNLKFHLAMLAVEKLLGSQVRSPKQLHYLASEDVQIDEDELEKQYELLKKWSEEYLAEHSMILERAAKTAAFSEYLLGKASAERAELDA